MTSPKLRGLATGRVGRAATVVALSGVMLACTTGTALAAVGTEPGAVTLNPASGPIASTPTWSTTLACNAGFQGSAVLREVHADGVTTNAVSTAVNIVKAPFSGTLQAPLTSIETLGGFSAGSTQELVVICFSGVSETGTSDPEMDTFVTYNTDGTYTDSVPLCIDGPPFCPPVMPVGAIGGIALTGLTATGLAWMQFRRLRSRRTRPVAAA